MKFSY